MKNTEDRFKKAKKGL